MAFKLTDLRPNRSPKLATNGSSPNAIPRGGQVGRISGLGVGALSAPLGDTQPGTLIQINQVQFNYQGPAKRIHVGVAWKAGGGFLQGVNFDNGGKILDGPGMFAFATVNVLASNGPVPHSFNVTASLLVPQIGSRPTRDGGALTVNEGGEIDTWQWAVDGSKVPSPTTSAAMLEGNFLGPIGTDKNIVRVVSAAPPPGEGVLPFVTDLQIRYTKL